MLDLPLLFPSSWPFKCQRCFFLFYVWNPSLVPVACISIHGLTLERDSLPFWAVHCTAICLWEDPAFLPSRQPGDPRAAPWAAQLPRCTTVRSAMAVSHHVWLMSGMQLPPALLKTLNLLSYYKMRVCSWLVWFQVLVFWKNKIHSAFHASQSNRRQ